MIVGSIIFLASLQTALAADILDSIRYIYDAAPILFNGIVYFFILYLFLFGRYVAPKLSQGAAVGFSALLAIGLASLEYTLGFSLFKVALIFLAVFGLMFLIGRCHQANWPMLLFISIGLFIAFIGLRIFSPGFFKMLWQDFPVLAGALYVIMYLVVPAIIIFTTVNFFKGGGFRSMERPNFWPGRGRGGGATGGGPGQTKAPRGYVRRVDRFLKSNKRFMEDIARYSNEGAARRARNKITKTRRALMEEAVEIKNNSNYARLAEDKRAAFEEAERALIAMGQAGGG